MKLDIMKKFVALTVILSLISFSCQREDEILGIWTRKGDDLAGMKVQVIKKGNILNGVIVFSTNYAKSSGFFENDIKWKGIKNIEGNNFEFEDLAKTVDNYGNIIEVYYDQARLIVENDTIYIRGYTKGREKIGTEQIWIKEK
jgi:hypothetical protein